MNKKTSLAPIIILLSFCYVTNAQTIDRGPYLQMVTTSSIYIHWRTDSLTDSKVWYGDDPNNLDFTLFDPADTTDHEIQITSLTSNTIYYYAVGDSNGQMAGGDNDHYFKTSPSSNQIIRAWVLGDAGTKNDNQRAVRDAYYDFVGNNHIDMMLLLGDNAYNDGNQDDFQFAWFENMYEDRLINSVMWSTFGNHDGNSADSETQTGPYYEIFNFPKEGEAGGVLSETEAYYSFDYGNMHIISLNSHDIDDSSNGAMMQWLQDDVDANTKDWLIAMFHHSAYTGSTTSMETNALPILENGGVDLVLWGHYHRYERSFLINGHYGTPESYDPETMTIDDGDGQIDGDGAYIKTNGGIGTIYVTTGSAGKISGGSSPHPIMVYNAVKLGSVDIEVNDLQMDINFIDTTGAIDDYFTIIKYDGPPTVEITYPLDNTFFNEPQSITIEANASDENGTISQVEFFIDNISIGVDYTSPYSMDWTMPANGSYEIKATATDNDDLIASHAVTILVGEALVCVQIDSGIDDGEEDAAGGMNTTSSDLELIQESSDQTVGMRFTNLGIPQGANIVSASIQFTCDKNVNINPCDLDIFAEDNDSPVAFTSSDFDITNRAKTNAMVTWSPPDWLNDGDAGSAQETDDISSVIQEVVDRPGFSTNSPIVIIIEGTGKREAESYEGSIPGSAELCIEFNMDEPLPVELLTFNAKTIEREIKLSWSTASEINNDFFSIERSINGWDFQVIGTVPGRGTIFEISEYYFFDKNPEIGLNFYKLKQTDYDGRFTYSKIITTEIIEEKLIRVYPSMVKDFVTIEKSKSIRNDLVVTIHDLNGNILQSTTIPGAEFKKDLSLVELMPGAYFISVYNNYSVDHFKIVKL